MTNGTIGALINKRTGANLIAQGARGAGLEYAVERPHGMTAWQIENTGVPRPPEVSAIRRAKTGPYVASLEVDFRIEDSEFTVTYELRANDPKLYVSIAGTWFQRGTPRTGVPVLNFALPLALERPEARYEIPFGAIDRGFSRGEEVPALRWAQVTGISSNAKAGCLLLNDSKHGHSLDGHVLRLSLIRSSYDPDILPEIGRHEIRLALFPFQGEFPVEQAIREGQAFNRALRPVGTSAHSGALDSSGEFFSLKPERVLLSAVKKAEENDSLIIRLFNPTDKDADAELVFNKSLLSAPSSVKELDLMEHPLKLSKAKISGRKVLAPVPARGIVSLLVGTRAPKKRAGVPAIRP